jgi:ribonuclease BN (tRNA processing enzyme)
MSARVTVLGSGTCFPTKGQKRRAHPGFFIRWGLGDEHLLIECSQCIAERLEKIGERPDEIRNLAVSHTHPDHFALPQFLQSAFCSYLLYKEEAEGQEHTVPHLCLFGPPHVLESVDPLNKIHFEETFGRGLDAPVIRKMEGSDHILPGGATLKLFKVSHGFDHCDAAGFRLTLPDGKVIGYSGDTGYCDGVEEIGKDADLFICEASSRISNQGNAVGYGHLSPWQAGKCAKNAGAKRLLLTHYSGGDTQKEMLQDCRSSNFRGRVTVATDGMNLKI